MAPFPLQQLLNNTPQEEEDHHAIVIIEEEEESSIMNSVVAPPHVEAAASRQPVVAPPLERAPSFSKRNILAATSRRAAAGMKTPSSSALAFSSSRPLPPPQQQQQSLNGGGGSSSHHSSSIPQQQRYYGGFVGRSFNVDVSSSQGGRSFAGDDSCDDESGTGTTNTGADNDNDNDRVSSSSKEEEEHLTKRETRIVNRSKLLVYIALTCAAAVVCATTYTVLRKEQTNTFQMEFLALTNEFTTQANTRAASVFGQLREFSTAITSQAQFDQTKFPFCTLPHFDRRAQVALLDQEAAVPELLGYAPIVYPNQVKEWQQYALEHQGWIDEDLGFRGWENTQQQPPASSIPSEIYPYQEEEEVHHHHGVDDETHGHDDDDAVAVVAAAAAQKNDDENHHHDQQQQHSYSAGGHSSSHHHDDDARQRQQQELDKELERRVVYNETSAMSYHLPLWQLGPVPQNRSIVNLDLMTHPILGRLFRQSSQYRGLTMPFDVQFLTRFAGQQLHNDIQQVVPRIAIVEPVCNDFNRQNFASKDNNRRNLQIEINTTKSQQSKYHTGIVFATIALNAYFENALSDGAGPIMVELSAPCLNKTSTRLNYRIHGPHADYLMLASGAAEFHDQCYFQEGLFHSAAFAPFLPTNPDSDDSDYDNFCDYTLNIFPTKQMAGKYETNRPILYAGIVTSIFVVTASVFLFYDFMVQRRQQKLLTTAKSTTAIVSSLFPKTVQKQLLKEAEEEEEAKARQQRLDYSSSLNLSSNSNHMLWSSSSTRSGFSRFSNHRSQMKDFLKDSSTAEAGGDNETEEFDLDQTAHTTTGTTSADILRTKPIADLFPEATIMFADIVGFTAWSSMREPTQVFILLESIYHEFDMIAKRRRVFKVETVGDCYVAVAGLPDPRKDHATVMARFASDCLYKMTNLVKILEVSLGPDTNELAMRFGLHSGPVTAGVLRGERARFQLFGDTVNTTSRIETTGMRDRIHVSQETAELLMASGKPHWLTLREDKVEAKGKGELVTYWLNVSSGRSSSSSPTPSSFCQLDQTSHRDLSSVHSSMMEYEFETDPAVVMQNNMMLTQHEAPPPSPGAAAANELEQIVGEKQSRLVDWISEVLASLLREIQARRIATTIQADDDVVIQELELVSAQPENMVLDEVQEIITLPKFNAQAAALQNQPDPATIVELPEEVVTQLKSYVTSVAVMYRNNPFHNFEHASHVTMSVVKLLSRIVAPELGAAQTAGPDNSCVLADLSEFRSEHEKIASTLHDHTYGITSDPLTQFAVVLSALIHDADHSGVSNAQLVAEQASIAILYRGKSVAEQNSVDLAWDLLLDEKFSALRRAIYCTKDEFQRFRHLVVNTVMATDIMDKDLGALRKARWNKAFSENKVQEEASSTTAVNRKATIVIEHLIQASDVAHTMQHWHVYRKWNARLFEELYRNYQCGRMEKNPAEFWYQGEIGFFDHYIIPLAKKLKDCGVFGVSSDEYLNYAQQNRKEWERRGKIIVEAMVESIRLTGTTTTAPA